MMSFGLRWVGPGGVFAGIACGSVSLPVDTKRSEGVVWTFSIGWSR